MQPYTNELLTHLATQRRVLRAALAEGSLPPLRDPDPALSSIDPQPILDRERSYQALETLQPSRGLEAEVAWRELEQADARFRDVLTAADGLDTSSIRAPHPVFGVLTLAQWTVFLGYHEARHAAQIRRTADDLERMA